MLLHAFYPGMAQGDGTQVFKLPKTEGSKTTFKSLNKLVKYHLENKGVLPCKLVRKPGKKKKSVKKANDASGADDAAKTKKTSDIPDIDVGCCHCVLQDGVGVRAREQVFACSWCGGLPRAHAVRGLHGLITARLIHFSKLCTGCTHSNRTQLRKKNRTPTRSRRGTM